MPLPAPRLRELYEVADGVHVATAEIWTSTTTVVVTADGRALVVDPGITVAEVDALAATVVGRGWRVTAGFSTHPHWDHVLWSRSLGDVPRWACPTAVRAQERSLAHDRAEVERVAPGHDLSLFGVLTPFPPDGSGPTPAEGAPGGAHLPWPGEPVAGAAHEPLVLVVEHRAHAPGHGALVLPGPGVIVVGDMLSDIEVPLLDLASPDPVGDYREGLDVLERAIAEHGLHTLVPGHGQVCTGSDEIWARLGADRAYLDALEAAARPDAAETDDDTVGDPRLTGDWVLGEHRRQLEHVRRTQPGGALAPRA